MRIMIIFSFELPHMSFCMAWGINKVYVLFYSVQIKKEQVCWWIIISNLNYVYHEFVLVKSMNWAEFRKCNICYIAGNETFIEIFMHIYFVAIYLCIKVRIRLIFTDNIYKNQNIVSETGNMQIVYVSFALLQEWCQSWRPNITQTK